MDYVVLVELVEFAELVVAVVADVVEKVAAAADVVADSVVVAVEFSNVYDVSWVDNSAVSRALISLIVFWDFSRR